MTRLNNNDTKQCRKLLERQRQEIDRALRDAEQSSQPVSLDQSKVGRVSRIDAIQQQELARAGCQALKTRRVLVERALQRIADGDYGECLECGEPIEPRRLLARPESTYCLQCQAALEGQGDSGMEPPR